VTRRVWSAEGSSATVRGAVRSSSAGFLSEAEQTAGIKADHSKKTGCASPPMVGIMFRRLTWEGHDFLDAIRDPEIWCKTKSGAEEVGSFTFDLLKELAVGLIKTKIEQHTGVKL
jgi:Hypothetical protein (DUF2513)